MSTRSVTPRSPTRPRKAGKRRVLLRRVAWFLAAVVVIGGVIAAIVAPHVDKAVQEVVLPLRHDDIIRQQAREKGLDPALIAGVIYTESRFRDQTSHAGAKGLRATSGRGSGTRRRSRPRSARGRGPSRPPADG